jgi:hypothetical protein
MLTNENKPEYNPGPGDVIKYPTPGQESANLGYETTDVNVSGVVVFLGGLFGFVLIFFVFCFLMGRVINEALNKHDGPPNRWHQQVAINASGGPEVKGHQKREDLKSNAAMEQQELQQMTTVFPSPRLQMDDGNQDTADLHAREDLLLEHYSSMPGQPGIRIPIQRAMQLIAQRGLPVAPQAQAGEKLAYDKQPVVTAPLTDGFARTGYELDAMTAREQKLNYGRAESSAAHAELRPMK